MKKTLLKRTLLVSALTVILLGAGLTAASWYLLDYALRPGNRGFDTERAWHEMDSVYPGLRAWHDSLSRAGAWHDTTLTALDGTSLHAFYSPAPHPTRRTALLVHGYTDCGVRMTHLARMYREELAMNILVPDLRHAGASGGDHIGMGWEDVDDLLLWSYMLPDIFGDSVSVVVHGVSMGAAATMMLSASPDQPSYIQMYVEDCGFTGVYEQFRKELREQFSLPAFPLLPCASELCRLRFGWKFEEASPLKLIRKSRGPMLFIHGTADTYVPFSMGEELFEAHPGPKARWWVDDATHARSYQKDPKGYARTVGNFLRNERL